MLTRLLRAHARTHVRALVLLMALQLLETAAAMALPRLNSSIIDHGVAAADAGAITRTGAAMLGMTACQMLCAGGVLLIGARVAAAVGHDLRAAVFQRVQSLPTRELERFGTATLIARTTGDVQQIQALVLLGLVMTVAAPLTLVWGVVLALGQDLPLTALLALVVPALGLPTALAVRRMRRVMARSRLAQDEVGRLLREQIGGQRVIRAFSRMDHEQSRFAHQNDELLQLALRMGRLMALMSPLTGLVLNGAGVAVLWLGGHRIASGDLRIGALTAFLGYLAQVLSSVSLAAYLFVVLPGAEVSARRIAEVLDAPTPPGTDLALPRSAGPGLLEVQDADFRYPNAQDPVLAGIRLTARPGETIGLVGPTGSGKSTLLNLILGLHEATEGAVLINGVDVRELDPAELSRAVSVVPQRSYLFSGTIADNLRHGRAGATDEELWQALDTAQAREFVARLPEQLAAPVTQGGANLSGGQRQRLAIARALLAEPAVLLLDDPASALDRATAADLRAALARTTATSTVVIAGQRMDAVRDADRIVVLEAGRVVGTGSHAQLLADNRTYQELARSQQDEDWPGESEYGEQEHASQEHGEQDGAGHRQATITPQPAGGAG